MVNLYGKPLRFLSGSQASLNDLQTAAAALTNDESMIGTFYLTDDTHRLYIGAEDCNWIPNSPPVGQTGGDINPYYLLTDGSYIKASDYNVMTNKPTRKDTISYYKVGRTIKPVPVNASINTVRNMSALTTNVTQAELRTAMQRGEPVFYYLQEENILCIYGSTGDPTYKLADRYDPNITYYAYNSNDGTYTAVSSNSITNSNYESYYIYESEYGWIQINSDTYISSIETAADNNIATITLIASNSNENNTDPSFNIASGNAATLTITKVGTNLTITAKPVQLETNETTIGNSSNVDSASIKLTGQTTSTITLDKGTFMDSFTEEPGKIVVNAASQKINKFEIATNPITKDKTLTIEQDSNYNVAGTALKPFDVTLPRVVYGQSGQTTTPLGETLSVYTISEIDNLISGARSDAAQSVNAMRYKGILGTDTNINTTIAYTISDTLYVDIGTTRPASGTYYYQTSTGAFVQGSASTETGEGKNNPSGHWYQQTNAVVGDTYRIGVTMQEPLTADQKNYFSDSAIGMFNGRELAGEIRLHKGDLIIANSDHKWDIVPAGDEPVYKLNTIDADVYENNELIRTDKVLELADADGLAVSSHKLITDDNLSINFSGSYANSRDITLSHTDQTSGLLAKSFSYNSSNYVNGNDIESTLTDPSDTLTEDITLISNIALDQYGHITNLNAIRLKQNQLKEVTTGTNNAKSQITYTITDKLGKSVNLIQNYQQVETNNSGIHFTINNSSNTSTISAEFRWGHF